MPALDSLCKTGPVPTSLALISFPLPQGVGEAGKQPDFLSLCPRGGCDLGVPGGALTPEVLAQKAQTS